jgi:hypothetical protein
VFGKEYIMPARVLVFDDHAMRSFHQAERKFTTLPVPRYCSVRKTGGLNFLYTATSATTAAKVSSNGRRERSWKGESYGNHEKARSTTVCATV